MAEREYLGAVNPNPDREILGSVTVSAPEDDYDPNRAFQRNQPVFGGRGGKAVVKPVTPLESIFAGATKSIVDPFVGTAQLLSGNTVGNELAQRLAQQGEVYSDINPVGYGAGRVAGALLPATAATKSMSVLPSFNKYLQASVLGGGGGLITPEDTGKTGADFYKEQAIKGGVGAIAAPVFTGAGDVAGYATKLGRRLIEPFTEAGKDKVVGRALVEAAGGESDKALQNIRDYVPSIKGVMPSMSEVAKVPSLAALERSAISNNPEVGNIIAQRTADRNILRKDFLENLAGKGGAKDALITARDLTAENNYLKAFNQKMAFKEVPTDLLAQKDELLKSPAVSQAIKDASANLANFGQKNINPTQSIQGLHEIKLALDDQIAKLTKTDMSQNEKRKIAGIEQAKTRLLDFLESDAVSPAYKKAREVYAAQSKPINEMEAIEGIAKNAINPNTDAIYAGQLARQLKNAERGKTVGSAKMDQLKALQADIQGQEFAKNAGKATGSDTAQKLAYSNLTNGMGLPNWLSGSASQMAGNLMGQVGNMAYSNANQTLSNKLAHAVTDPKEAARLMQLAKEIQTKPSKMTEEKKRLIELLGSQTAVQYNPFTAKGVTE